MQKTFLIFSDSIAKYVSLDGADVFAFRGATIGEITYQSEKYKESIDGYHSLIIHVGTNDVYKLSENQFISAYCNLISVAKSLFPNTVIGLSCILPRPVDFNRTNPKIDKVNKALYSLCAKYKVHCLRTYKYFMKGGKPLVELFAYKDGGLHLNSEGTRVLGLYFRRMVAHF